MAWIVYVPRWIPLIEHLLVYLFTYFPFLLLFRGFHDQCVFRPVDVIVMSDVIVMASRDDEEAAPHTAAAAAGGGAATDTGGSTEGSFPSSSLRSA